MPAISDSVFAEKYRRETQHESQRMGAVLPGCVNTIGVDSGDGKRVTFYRTDAASKPVKKTGNGRLPSNSVTHNAIPADLDKWHEVIDIDNFDEFRTSFALQQANRKALLEALNRHRDDEIIRVLDTTTTQHDGGAAVSLNEDVALNWRKQLADNVAIVNGRKITALCTTQMEVNLMKIETFRNSDYVEVKPFSAENMYVEGAEGTIRCREWLGIKWIFWNDLPGQGTAAAKSFLFTDNSVGHVTRGIESYVGQNERDDEVWVRHSCILGTALVEPKNVIELTHDDTA